MTRRNNTHSTRRVTFDDLTRLHRYEPLWPSDPNPLSPYSKAVEYTRRTRCRHASGDVYVPRSQILTTPPASRVRGGKTCLVRGNMAPSNDDQGDASTRQHRRCAPKPLRHHDLAIAVLQRQLAARLPMNLSGDRIRRCGIVCHQRDAPVLHDDEKSIRVSDWLNEQLSLDTALTW